MSTTETSTTSVIMADHPFNADTVRLAGLAADLSTTLCSLQEKCGHETTSTDISNIATELALLSQSLWRLHEAMAVDAELYTESFNEDLSEITKELRLIFEEITDCCEELQQADAENAGSVAWMFKKGRVHKLQKHLEALKTTVVVMRLVLWHGKDYGTHNCPGRLAESSPHTMHEDRVIMESVFAKNRNAIFDIHMLDSQGHRHSSSSSSELNIEHSTAKAGDHHRKLSTSTGVECPPLPDVLPPASTSSKPTDKKTNPPVRRFSKRGARLAVHASILNMEANEVPVQLKNKWIQHTLDRNHQRMPSLSKISEVDSTQSNNNLRQFALGEPPSGDALRKAGDDSKASKPPLQRNLPSMVVECPAGEDGNRKMADDFPPKRRPSVKMITTPLRKMMHKLSLSHESTDDVSKGLGRLSISNLQAAPLKTPDFDREFENGV